MDALKELGDERFNKHYRLVFGNPCLDFVKTIVFNLPEPCYANCEYCIDHYLRSHTTSNEQFWDSCEKVLKEFPNVKSVSITGGSLNPFDYNRLVHMIKYYLPLSRISFNTNGVLIDDKYIDENW